MATSVGARLRANAGRLVSGIALAGVAAIGVVAVAQPGFPQQPPVPQNRSIWVANGQQSLVGRINPAAAQLDSALEVNGGVELLQDGGVPMVLDTAADELQFIDPATVTIGARVKLPADPAVRVGGGTVAVADLDDGSLWVGVTGSAAGLDATSAPVGTVGARPALVVSEDGTVFAAAADADQLTVVRGSVVSTTPIPGGALPSTPVQLSTVGDQPVLFDPATGSLRMAGQRFEVTEAAGAVLQQPGPADDAVLLATPTELLQVSLEDGTVTVLAGSFGTGTPHPPVRTEGCGYGLWTGNSSRGIRACRGVAAAIEPLTGEVDDGYLVGRGADVVITDPTDGRSWLASDGFRLVENWDDVLPPDVADQNRTDLVEDEDTDRTPPPPPNCATVPIGAPQAKDDELGVRAGRTTVLRVLENDPTVDCTSVVISGVSELPADVGSVTVVAGGSALQLTLPDIAAGELPELTYQVDNGRGVTAEAKLTVSVAPPAASEEPRRLRRPAVQVEAGATVGYNVLADYLSPTGDDLYLVSASTDDGDEVAYRPDGTITYRSTGTGAGSDRTVEFVVSDGTRQVSGTLNVTIAEPGSSTPISFPAHLQSVAGQAASVDVTRTMISGSAERVVISQLTPVPGADGALPAATASVDDHGRLITAVASAPGSYYFTFQATAGDQATTGVLRLDAVSTYDKHPVVPMLDVAYVPAGGPAIVDPLANDSDPAGNGLAVQQVGNTSGVSAAVTDLHFVRIEAQHALTAPAALQYSVFDGSSVATGEIRVVSVPAPDRIPPPLAEPIAMTVRAGDAVTVPIDAHAASQDGSPLTVTLDDSQTAAVPGVAFSTGTEIRYLAPADAPAAPVVFGYTAVAASSTDDAPVRASSTVTVTVTPASSDQNHPPTAPPPVVARVFAGGTVTVELPLAGVDPDGDWVTATSLLTPAAPLGRVTLTGSSSLGYTALDIPGVDRIEYRVSDSAGAAATGAVIVLVVPPVGAAGPPVAPDLTATVRPGATIRIDPLSSVSDPAGSPVRLADPAYDAPPELPVTVDADALLVTAPATESVLSLRYTVVNAKELTASGAIRLTVSATAPQPPPIARDVFVPPTDLGKGAATVDVDVSSRITNRTGPRSALSVSVAPVSAGVAQPVGPATVRVTLADQRQVVAYRVTDGNGSTATAFLVVPPKAQLIGPQLIAGKDPVTVDAGTSVRIALADYVVVAGGSPALADGQPLQATQGTATAVSDSEVDLAVPTDAGGAAVLYLPIATDGAPAVLGLPVRIIPRVVPPPRLDSTALLVEVGTNASLDLAPLTSTFDAIQADSLTYRLDTPADAVSRGYTVNLSGTMFSVALRTDVPRNTSLVVPVMVTDGDGQQGVAAITVRATGSTKPLPIVVSQQTTGRAGQQVTVDLLQGSSDPIGLGLTLSDVQPIDGAGGVSSGPSLSGSVLTFGTAPGFVGDITISFDAVDATQDPERTVTGTFRITLQDRPSQPGAPTVVAGSRTVDSVQLSWSPSDAHGSAISGYTVRSGAGSWECAADSGTCQITGLTTGVPYEFTVVAHNALGDSDVSPVSEQVIPDEVPSGYGAPSASYVARSQIAVDWSVPGGSFSPVSSMDVQILANGAPSSVRSGVFPPLLIDGLDPGTSYSFQVRASNREGTGDWSAASGAVLPSGVPGEPRSFGGAYLFDGSTQQVQLSWQPPSDNGGESITGYVLRDGSGNDIGRPNAGDTTATVQVNGSSTVSFSLIAVNPRGAGPAATTSVTAFTRPGQVSGLSLQRRDGALTANWSPVETPGSTIGEYQYRVSGGGWNSAGTNTSITIGGLTNGTSYTVSVRACNSAPQSYPDFARCGDVSGDASASPYGPITAPVIAMATPTTLEVTATWSFSDGNGRPVVGRAVTIRVNGDDQKVDLGSGRWTGTVPSGATVVLAAAMCVSGPDECTQSEASVTGPYQFTVGGPNDMGGVCGEQTTGGGAWVTQAACTGGKNKWAADGAKVLVGCKLGGGSYPSKPPSANPTSSTWLKGLDGRYYRAVAMTTNGPQPPDC